MGPATAEFQATLSGELDARSDGNQPKKSIFATLLPLLIQVLVTAIDGCLNKSDPQTAAASACNPSPIVRARMRRLMVRDLYDGSLRRYNREGGNDMLDATFASCQKMGEPRMAKVFEEVQAEPDPTGEWNMG